MSNFDLKTLNEDADKERALTIATSVITDDLKEALMELGRIQSAQSISDMLSAGVLMKLQDFKAKKGYEIFKGQTKVIDGVEYKLDTWEGYCKSLGKSRLYFDERLTNLRLLGEEALTNAQRIGISTTQFRKLRQLDETDQKVVIDELEANIGDRDAIVELIEDMTAKHIAKENKLKDEIKDQKKQIKSLKDESEAKDRVLADKNKLLDEKTTALELKLNAPAHERAKDYLTEIGVIEVEAVQVFGRLNALYQQIQDDQAEGEPVQPLCAPRMGHALMAIISQANDMLDFYQLGDINMGDDMSWVDEANAEIARQKADDSEGGSE